MAVIVLSNDGEIAVLKEEDGTLVHRHRARTNAECRRVGQVEISQEVWMKIWPIGKTMMIPMPPDAN